MTAFRACSKAVVSDAKCLLYDQMEWIVCIVWAVVYD